MSNLFGIKLPSDIKVNLSLQPPQSDIIKLLSAGNLKVLSKIAVSVDSHGKVISIFADNIWHLWPYHVGDREKAKLNFSFCDRNPNLQMEAKIILYIWLRFRGSWKRSGKISVHTLWHRLRRLKYPLLFLIENNHASLADLNDSKVWNNFEKHMTQLKITQEHLSSIFSAIKAVTYISEYLPFKFVLKNLEPDKLSKKLNSNLNGRTCQSVAIPQRIADLIYGKALETVEEAWIYRNILFEVRDKCHKDYIEAKTQVDAILDSRGSKSKQVNLPSLTKSDRQKNNKKYRVAIQSRRKPIDQIAGPLLAKTSLKITGKSSNQVEAFCNLILIACFICLVAFSGMRISEAYQLRLNCYLNRTINRQKFHILLGGHHKLSNGLKRDEWVCSPIAQKAVELASILTKHLRKEMLISADIYEQKGDFGKANKLREDANCLWLSRLDRGKTPSQIGRSSIAALLSRFTTFAKAIVRKEDLVDFHLLNRTGQPSKKPKVGEHWKLSPNQMRRTFAVFSSRHNLASLPAIKQQFKHVIMQMTSYYCNGASEARSQDARLDTELIAMVDSCRIDFETDKLYEFHNSDMKLAGGKGKTIMLERSNSPIIYKDRSTIRKLVQEGKLTYHETGVAGCTNGYKCEFDGIINAAYCVECDGAVIEIYHGKDWQKKHKECVEYLHKNTDTSPNEFTHFITQIRAAEQVMSDLDLSFQSYEA